VLRNGGRRTRRREVELTAALPDLLDRAAGGLRAGAPPLVALAEAAAAADVPPGLAADLVRVVGRATGVGAGPALAAWAEERPVPAVAAVAAALQVTIGAGGPGAAALEGLATGLRDRHDAAAEIVALSAQARMSAVVVGAAPVASLALSLLADRRVAPTLLTTAPGRACLAGGVALEGLAAWWMRRILRCGA
jgi:tight adherence protein B